MDEYHVEESNFLWSNSLYVILYITNAEVVVFEGNRCLLTKTLSPGPNNGVIWNKFLWSRSYHDWLKYTCACRLALGRTLHLKLSVLPESPSCLRFWCDMLSAGNKWIVQMDACLSHDCMVPCLPMGGPACRMLISKVLLRFNYLFDVLWHSI